MVEAFMESANGTGTDSHRVLVTRNSPESFEGGNTANWIVGKPYEVKIKTMLSDYNPVKDGKVIWKKSPELEMADPGVDNDLKIKLKATVKGDYIVTAELGEKKITLNVKAEEVEIKRWCITDKDLDFKSDAGWGEELYALIESSPIVTGEKIHLHLLEFDSSNDSNYIKDLGEVSFDEKGIAKVKFTTDEIKTELNKLNFERGNYEMFFAAEFKEGGVQFAEVSRKKRGGKDTVYPVKTVSHSELEKAKFTYIDSKKDITSVRFLKSNGKDAYEVIKYGEPIKVKVQTRNLNGTRLTGQMFVNLFANGLHKAQVLETKEVKDETVEWDLNTAECKEKIAKSQTNRISFWQVEVTEEKSTGGETVQHPPKTARKKNGELDWQSLLTYQSLKLSDVGKTSELAKTNAPLIVGEPLEMKDSHTEGKCLRCQAEITQEEFNLMFPDVKQLFYKGTNNLASTSIKTFLTVLNKTLKEFEINTCIKKAFFLSQITKETGYFSRIDENLYYTTEAALHSFWRKSSHPRLYSNPNEFFKNPEKLGNYVYRDLAENEGEASGDGYKYRGRGLIQITRKKGYRRFGEYVGKDLKANPDLLLSDLDLMVRSSGWYWKHGVLLNNGSEKDLNTVAETGDFKETTRLVHGSTDDVSARETILTKIKSVLKTDECKKTTQSDILSEADIEFQIFQNSGEIHYKIHDEKREIVEYFYHDSGGNIHKLGKYKLNKVKENYGGVYKDKLGKDSNNIYLIDIRTVKQSYKNDSIGFTLTINTSRYYMNDVSLASLYGAMLECGYSDFVFNGFSNEKGESVGGSKSHKNGMNGDLRYLRKDKKGGKTDLFNSNESLGWKGLDEERQNKFNDALYKFGWKSMLSQYYGERGNKLLNHCTNDKDKNHNDHLHIQGFTPNLKEIK